MCSPSGSSNTDEHASAAATGFINNSSTPQSGRLQPNQQPPISDRSIKPNSSGADSLAPMPPQVSNRRNKAPTTTTREMSSKTCRRAGDSLEISAGSSRFMSTKVTPSSNLHHKFNYLTDSSPISTSDIWATGTVTTTSTSTTSVTPSSPPDYLRDIDEVLTPSTALSTIPSSRTPSEEDIDDPWRTARKSLEIPDLDTRNNSSAITRHPQQMNHPYGKKEAHVNRVESNKYSASSLISRKKLAQNRSTEASQDVHSCAIRDSSFIIASDGRNAIKTTKTQSSVDLNTTLVLKREAHHVNCSPAKAKEYHEKSRKLVLSPSSNNVQGGHQYYNQSPLTPQRHHRVQNVPRSPYAYKSSHHPSPQGSKYSHGHAAQQQHPKSHPSNSNSTVSLSSASGARPTYEVLKTLLRKKACLYEPGTSKAIALITWLVGRELALSHGYFSRQHLQSGVHAVVGDKIDCGMITRTKVNRCMQIILNSCFHYIIPRPDGSEEKGDLFRESFANSVSDDAHLLSTLPHPWDDLKITKECLTNKEEDLKVSEESNSSKDKGAVKRIVLLCFNENVRSAEDVLRCHNDFIRDAAITGKLHLSADEWRQFFSLKDEDGSITDPAPLILKPKNGCDIPYLSFKTPDEVSNCLDNKDKALKEPWGQSIDLLGQMNMNELNKFRTTWCCKRYDHDHSMCRFAHVEVNRGWLRRDPSLYNYEDKMCPHVTIIDAPSSELNGCYINSCPHGVNCKYAHSQEEIDYHPRRYKSNICESSKSGYHNCTSGDICPRSHPSIPRSPSNAKSGRSNYLKRSGYVDGKAKSGNSANAKNDETPSVAAENCIPAGAPIIYHKQAPSSEFENTFMFPGLKSLYRQNCAVAYSYYVCNEKSMQAYSIF